MKKNIARVFEDLHARGIHVEILTGDKQVNAERLFGSLGIPIRSELSPETKLAVVDAAKSGGATVVMVGDGLNDAPALAQSDVGVIFSGTENSAAIDAAEVVILGGDMHLVKELFLIARRSMRIASQSIWGGVTLSIIGMGIAAFGFIPPVQGALLQEAIDIAVILNSLRTLG
jgi:P-type E1-E2 ATPase